MNEQARVAFLDRLDRIKVWKRGDRRAPHKPLLLLLALGRVYGGKPRLARYGEGPGGRDSEGPNPGDSNAGGGSLENRLLGLLKQFGPSRRIHRPSEPYARLPGDGLWEVRGLEVLPKRAGGIPNLSALRETRGGFPTWIYDLLRSDTALVLEAAQEILDGHFPRSLHGDIRDAVGLPYLYYESGLAGLESRIAGQVGERTTGERLVPKRDPAFRRRVLRAYQRRCAVCDFDVRVEDQLLGLEAAHIMWHAAGGPDHVPNGLALCSLHHKALDLGAIGLRWTDARVRILVSSEVNGMSAAVRQLLDYRDAPLRLPPNPDDAPSREYVMWHGQEVFRRPALGGGRAA